MKPNPDESHRRYRPLADCACRQETISVVFAWPVGVQRHLCQSAGRPRRWQWRLLPAARLLRSRLPRQRLAFVHPGRWWSPSAKFAWKRLTSFAHSPPTAARASPAPSPALQPTQAADCGGSCLSRAPAPNLQKNRASPNRVYPVSLSVEDYCIRLGRGGANRYAAISP